MPRFIAGVFLAALAAAPSLATTADAQIMRRPAAPRAINWAGVSVGLTQGYTILDGSTGSDWEFGSGLEYAVALEHPTGSGIAMGLRLSFADMPLRFSSPTFTGDATANVTSLMGVFHYGGGYSFHPVYELAVGVVGFSDFRSSGTPELELSSSTDYDPRISLGYGFGLGISSRLKVEVIQEFGTIVHQRDGLSGNASSYPGVHSTRIGGKISF